MRADGVGQAGGLLPGLITNRCVMLNPANAKAKAKQNINSQPKNKTKYGIFQRFKTRVWANAQWR